MQTESYATGWLCPRCKKINAPWSSQCICMGEYKINCTENDGVTIDKMKIDQNPSWWGKITTNPQNPFSDVSYTTATTSTNATINTGEKNYS